MVYFATWAMDLQCQIVPKQGPTQTSPGSVTCDIENTIFFDLFLHAVQSSELCAQICIDSSLEGNLSFQGLNAWFDVRVIIPPTLDVDDSMFMTFEKF